MPSPAPSDQNISTSLQSTLMHSLKLSNCHHVCWKRTQSNVEASDAKSTLGQVVMLYHFASLPSCSQMYHYRWQATGLCFVTRDWQCTMDHTFHNLEPRHCHWMDTQGSSVLKASPDQMVCSRQPWTSHTWPPFLIKLGNCQLNCTVKLTNRCDPPKKPTTEHAKIRHDLTSSLNSSKGFIMAYHNQFEGIGQFPGNYHITLCNDAKPVVHAPRKCPIPMWPWCIRN